MLNTEVNNPFQYLSPEHIDANTAINMFVDVFKDYYQILNIGHTFIHGARGSGKSMMFRIMKSDCQKIIGKTSLNKLPFYSIYIPIKDTSLNISELSILEKRHGGEILNEHLLCLYFGICIFKTLAKEDFTDHQDCKEDIYEFYKYVISLIEKSGHKDPINKDAKAEIKNYFIALMDLCSSLLSEFSIQYLSRLMFSPERLPYNGALCI